MREDMARIIVERPRVGGDRCRKGRAVPLEDLPRHEGMRRRHKLSGDCRMLNENLAPLRRYLERQVDRPWDKVYSEIARHLRPSSAVQQHVRDHLSDFVAIKPCRRFWFRPLYVDPKDGLLKRTDRLPKAKASRRRRDATEPPSRIALREDAALHLIGGIWYEVKLAPLPEPQYRAVREIRKVPLKRCSTTSPIVELEMMVRRLVTPAVRDVVTGAAVPAGAETDDEQAWATYRRAHPDRRYAVSKRALSHTELRRHELCNSAPED